MGEADDAFRVWAQDGGREQELGQAVWGLRQGMWDIESPPLCPF